MYLTLEGIDGVGKSTQIPLLAERFKQLFPEKNIVTTFEPGSSVLGPQIRSLLFDVKKAGVVNLHPVASGLLYLSDHIQHQHEKVNPTLEAGDIVIQDRSFIDSQRAYYDQGEADKCYVAHPKLHPECRIPDLTVVLLMEPKACLERAIARGDAKFLAKPWSNEASLTKIQYRYLKMANETRFSLVWLDPTWNAERVNQILWDGIQIKLALLNKLESVTNVDQKGI